MEPFLKIADELKRVYYSYVSSGINDKIERLENEYSESISVYGKYKNKADYYNLDFNRLNKNHYNNFHYSWLNREDETYSTTILTNVTSKNPAFSLWKEYHDCRNYAFGSNYFKTQRLSNNLLDNSHSLLKSTIINTSENSFAQLSSFNISTPAIIDASFIIENIQNLLTSYHEVAHLVFNDDNVFDNAHMDLYSLTKAFTNRLKDFWLTARKYCNRLYRLRKFIRRDYFESFCLKIKEILIIFINEKQLSAIFKKIKFLRFITFSRYLSAIYSYKVNIIDNLKILTSINHVKRVEGKVKWKKSILNSNILERISTLRNLMKHPILKLFTAVKLKLSEVLAGHLENTKTFHLQLTFS